MSKVWLNIVGIGEDGLAGLSPAAQAAVQRAEVLIGGARHHALTAELQAERVTWPSPFDAMIERIGKLKG
ncbi:MAG: cobalamin biosynthesis bifunctional protein CbiET, partial [Pseudomonadota bacterium]